MTNRELVGLVAANGWENEQTNKPLNEGHDRDRAQQSKSRQGRPLDPASAGVENTEPAPGDENHAGQAHDETGRVGTEGILKLASHEVGKAGRHATTRTGNSEQEANGAGRQA